MYDFRIEAATSRALPRADRGRRRADRRRAGRDRQHGECRGVAVGRVARSQLGGLLPQCRRRAGAGAVPGQGGVHPHSVRQGGVRDGGGDARGAVRRGRARLSGPYRLRRGEPLRAGDPAARRRRADRGARPRQPAARPLRSGRPRPAVPNWHSGSKGASAAFQRGAAKGKQPVRNSIRTGFMP